MGAPMGLHPDYNPYSQPHPSRAAAFQMGGAGPMDGPNGSVMGGQCGPGLQGPMHNGSGLGPPHSIGAMGQQLTGQAQAQQQQQQQPPHHHMYPDFGGGQPDQRMMASQMPQQHQLPEQLLPGEPRGVKRESDLIGTDPSKRLASSSMLSHDENALSHAPRIDDACPRCSLGSAIAAESADNGSTKDDNVTEKDESTQESTNTIESAKTETEDDDPSKVS